MQAVLSPCVLDATHILELITWDPCGNVSRGAGDGTEFSTFVHRDVRYTYRKRSPSTASQKDGEREEREQGDAATDDDEGVRRDGQDVQENGDGNIIKLGSASSLGLLLSSADGRVVHLREE